MKKEKRKTIITNVVIAAIALILVLGLAVTEMKKEGILGSKESIEIVNGFNKVYNSEERSIVYYSSSGCGYCELQTPILETIAKDYSLEYYSIDSSLLTKSQIEKITEILGIEGKTPTILIVEDGKVIDTQLGYTEGREFVEFLKENEILEDDAVYSKEQYITFINYEEYKELIKNKKKNIIVIGQTTCSHCIAIKPALNSVAHEYDLTINYLNLTKLTKEESTEFFESLEDIGYDDPEFIKKGSFGTPLTLIVKKGKVVNYISGLKTFSQLVREFTKAGLIEE